VRALFIRDLLGCFADFSIDNVHALHARFLRSATDVLHLKLLLTCAQVGDGVFEVLSTSGDTHLGGDDFDKRIVDFLADDFQKNEGIDLRKDRCGRS
jgi:hypothetical protein